MTAAVSAPTDPLAPVREALLEDAGADADRTLADADADAAAVLAAAREQADEVLAAARAEGRADAEAQLAADRARARRQARAVVLAAQRAAYDDLRDAVHAAARALRDDPAYAPWRDRLAAGARQAFGPDAVVTEHPDGGVLVVAGSRRAAETLAGLADRAVEALGPDLEGLWTR